MQFWTRFELLYLATGAFMPIHNARVARRDSVKRYYAALSTVHASAN